MTNRETDRDKYTSLVENSEWAVGQKNGYTVSDWVCKWVSGGQQIHIVCPRSSAPFYVVTYSIKWVTTSWKYSREASLLIKTLRKKGC